MPPNTLQALQDHGKAALTVELPTDASRYVQALDAINDMQPLSLTAEDRQRGAMYAAERKEARLEGAFTGSLAPLFPPGALAQGIWSAGDRVRVSLRVLDGFGFRTEIWETDGTFPGTRNLTPGGVGAVDHLGVEAVRKPADPLHITLPATACLQPRRLA